MESVLPGPPINFCSIDEKHEISIKILENTAWFNIVRLEYEHYKTFLLMFKELIEYLNSKNIQFIKQIVLKTDIEFFKNSTSFDYDEFSSIISTPLDKLPGEIYHALGINRS